jgi:hypothetical protein
MKTLDLQKFRKYPSLKVFRVPPNIEILGKGWPWFMGSPFGIETIIFQPRSKLRIVHDYAFCGLDLVKSITIPASVVTMTGLSFEYSGIRKIEIAKANAKFRNQGNLVVNTKGNCLVRYAGVEQEVTGGDEITKLDKGCFSSCDWITAIHFDSRCKIRQIPQSTFELCQRLESMIVPASVEAVGRVGFSHCSRIRTVSFAPGSKLKEIEPYAFGMCYLLESILFPPSLATIGEGCFECCINLGTVGFTPDSILSALKAYTFDGCFALRSLFLPSSITRIAEKCFVRVAVPDSRIARSPAALCPHGHSGFRGDNCAFGRFGRSIGMGSELRSSIKATSHSDHGARLSQ